MEFNSGFKGLIQYTRNGGNAIPKHAGPKAEGSNPTTGLTLLWARNPFWENFNYWQVSWNLTGQQGAQLHDKYDDDDKPVHIYQFVVTYPSKQYTSWSQTQGT
jgi:hypothetical protein